jgi:hypothetical protein
VKRVYKKIGYAEEKSMIKVRLYCVDTKELRVVVSVGII